MKDGIGIGAVKRAVRMVWTIEFAVRRKLRGGEKAGHFELTGQCQMCAKCCEEPSIHVGPVVWFLAYPRRWFLWWQKTVNGFELLRSEHETRTLVFRCTHFNWTTRRCDSYETRPFLCRDYPRFLFDQPWPELFDECGYRALLRNRDAMNNSINATDLSPEKKGELRRRLKLE